MSEMSRDPTRPPPGGADPEHHRLVGELFWRARELEPAARDQFFAENTACDSAIRAEILALLEADTTAAIDAAIRSGLGREVALLVESKIDASGETWADDRYELRDRLGKGGMGTVYLAWDRLLEREVALKVLTGLSPGHTQRFFDEIRVQAHLDHPNIVPMYNVGFHERGPFYTMRVVRGRTLAYVLAAVADGDPASTTEYSLARRVKIFVDVCQALAYAHGRGVIHRDLKPANVMLGPYGEVQVMDWGVSRAYARNSMEIDPDEARTKAGHVVGTPAYMAPEQADGSASDARVDVYALGVILYELLTLTRPFVGDSRAVMDQHIKAEPEPPLRRAPGRNVPIELQGICMKALRKKPDERFQTARELTSRVQSWLEASTDKEKRRQLAEAASAEGRVRLDEFRRRKADVVRLEAESAELETKFEPWQNIDAKADLFASRAALRRARRDVTESAASVIGTLERALGYEKDCAAARELLSDYYWSRFEEAETLLNDDEREFYRDRVSRYHDGKYAHELRGDGTLSLTSDPPRAEVWLEEFVEKGPTVVGQNRRKLGLTPVAPLALPMGSYLLVVSKNGYRDTRYPVYISRNRSWNGTVKLRSEAEIGADMIFVPNGPCILGGDGGSIRTPRFETTISDFAIARHPVTMAEYLEFINEVARADGLMAAQARSPRRTGDDPQSSYLLEDGAGGLELPEVDVDGDAWIPRHPALAISWFDAVAYCEWRSRRDGREYRLPTTDEWEKAARGVDGRLYPWGNYSDPSLCNLIGSHESRVSPVAVDEFPTDLSVYGVRGAGGNVADWAATEHINGKGEGRRISYAVLGGSWRFLSHRANKRDYSEPQFPYDYVGFRLARSL